MVLRTRNPDRVHLGMTLIELLVVVTIVVLLVATSVPLMKPALEDSQLREASRQVNVFFTAVRGRAIQTRRPVGVMLQRRAPGENAVLDLSVVEEPHPFAGDFIGATATLADANGDGKVDSAVFSAAMNGSLPFLVQVGDSIRFNYQGAYYEIVQIQNAGANLPTTLTFKPPSAIANQGADGAWGRAGVDDDNDGTVDNRSEAGWWNSDDGPAPPLVGIAVPYQVFRAPTKSSVNPLQLAGGTCIDLEYSGIGASGVDFNSALQNQIGSPPLLNAQPVLIMFDPGGSVSLIYTGVYNNNSMTPAIPLVGGLPQGTIHLLIGRFDQTRLPPDATGNLPATSAPRTNLSDTRNVWISIGDRTGAVTSSENAGDSVVANAREFARSGQGMGGR